MTRGATPAYAHVANLPRTLSPSFLATSRRTRRTAAAPSETCEALPAARRSKWGQGCQPDGRDRKTARSKARDGPACVVPSFANAGLSLASDSYVVPARMPSSWSTTMSLPSSVLGSTHSVCAGRQQGQLRERRSQGAERKETHLDGHDLALEPALLLGVLGPAERLGREAVLLLARDAVVLGDVLARDAAEEADAGLGQLRWQAERAARRATSDTHPIGIRTSDASLLLRTSSLIFSGSTPAP